MVETARGRPRTTLADGARNIASRHGYDPAAAHSPGNLSVLEAVARDPEFAHLNEEVYYGLRKELQLVLDWLTHYRVFANQWDEVPNDRTRKLAFDSINDERRRNGRKPLRRMDFWTEARAIRYHNTGHCHRYPIVPRTPEIDWLEANREQLIEQMSIVDRGGDVEGMLCPVGSCPVKADL